MSYSRSPQGQILKLATVKDDKFDIIATHADILFVVNAKSFDVKAFEQALSQENRKLEDVQLFVHWSEVQDAPFQVGGQFYYADELSKIKNGIHLLKSNLQQKQLQTS